MTEAVSIRSKLNKNKLNYSTTNIAVNRSAGTRMENEIYENTDKLILVYYIDIL